MNIHSGPIVSPFALRELLGGKFGLMPILTRFNAILFNFAIPDQLHVASQMNFSYETILDKYGVSGTGATQVLASVFTAPNGIARDASGNLYVADTANGTIRKIASGGSVTTLAGLAENPGSADGTGSDARFNSPAGVAVDSAGNIYVTETSQNAVRIYNHSGQYLKTLTVANPFCAAVNSSGNLYVGRMQGDGSGEVDVYTPALAFAGRLGIGAGVGIEAQPEQFDQPGGDASPLQVGQELIAIIDRGGKLARMLDA